MTMFSTSPADDVSVEELHIVSKMLRQDTVVNKKIFISFEGDLYTG